MKIKTKPKISLGLSPVVLLAFLVAGVTSLVAQTPPNAGASIVNTATVNYEIDGTGQPPVTDDETFVIDALINPVVAAAGGVTVSPGETNVAIPFTVTNGGNQTQDFVLNAVNRTDDGTGQLQNITVYHDVNGDGLLDVGDVLIDITDQTATQAQGAASNPFDDIAPGTTINVIVVGDVPASGVTGTLVQGQSLDVDLIAVAFQSGGGGAEVENTPDGTTGKTDVDVLFGDGDGPATGDADTDGIHSATNTATAAVVSVSILKEAAVVLDADGNATTDQYYVPGATVEYTITISYSGSTSTTAGEIVMTDPIPAGTIYVADSIDLNGDATITDADDVDEGEFTGFTGTLPNPDAGTGTVTVTVATGVDTRDGNSSDDVIKFRVTIAE